MEKSSILSSTWSKPAATGCLSSHDLPDWQIVYYYFATWKKSLLIETLYELLVEKTRVAAGRKEEPSAAIIDSQSVKITLVSTEHSGFDAGKKLKGIKRPLTTDTMGLIPAQCRRAGKLPKG